MNGFPFAKTVTRLAGDRRHPYGLFAAGLVGLGLAVMGLAWIVSGFHRDSGSQTVGYRATLTDSPSWERVRPEWPKYMPSLPPAGQAANAPASGAPATTPAVVYSAPSADPAPPLIATGPELFLPFDQPVSPPPAQPQSWAENPASQDPLQPPSFDVPVHTVAPVAKPPRVTGVRGEMMEKIATQSDQQIRHGFELADRGAYFAARAEFTAALRLIAQGLDSEENTTIHSQALSAGLTALQEAQDFVPAQGRLEGGIDLQAVVAAHDTPLLKNAPVQQVQAMRALTQYHTYAQEQLAVSAGHEVSGSMALGALGKMHAAIAGKPNPEIAVPEAKAIVFFQAALLVCPKNYMAANDLGVLLAHNGDNAGARRVLEHSVLICRTSENLNNLSVVYRQLGEQRLSALAAQKSQVAKASEIAQQKSANLAAGGAVQWVDPAALAQSPGQWADPARPAATIGQAGPMTSQPAVGLTPSPYGPTTTH